MAEKCDGYRVLVGKPEGKTSLLRYRCRSKDNIKMYLTWKDGTAGTGYLAQDRNKDQALVDTVMTLQVL
jgi:hypothetical protein